MARDWLYGLYDMRNAEQCILIADRIKPIADYLGVLESSVRTGITYDKRMLGRYKVVKIKEDKTNENDDR